MGTELKAATTRVVGTGRVCRGVDVRDAIGGTEVAKELLFLVE